jgi:protein SCO1/2
MKINRKLAIALGIILGTPVLAVWLFATLQPIKVLPRLKLAPGYSLLAQEGKPFTSDMVRGQVVLYQFGYTNCGANCQPIWARLKEVLAQLATTNPDGAVPVKLVTLTLDGERDTPAVLQAFGQQIGADFSHWTFLTGSQADLRPVLQDGFGVAYKRLPDGSVDFLNRFELVDGWGIVRAEYIFGLPSSEELTRDIELVVAEARNSHGAARYAYEAAHLFGCYQTQG